MSTYASRNLACYFLVAINEHYELFDYKTEKEERAEFLSRVEEIIHKLSPLEGKDYDDLIDLCEEYVDFDTNNIKRDSIFWAAVRNSIDIEFLQEELIEWAYDTRIEAKSEEEDSEAE